jgi:hypothetical protein
MLDLSICLKNVGIAAKSLGQMDDATKAFEEGYEIAKRLAAAFPGIAEYAKLPDSFSTQLRDLSKKIK